MHSAHTGRRGFDRGALVFGGRTPADRGNSMRAQPKWIKMSIMHFQRGLDRGRALNGSSISVSIWPLWPICHGNQWRIAAGRNAFSSFEASRAPLIAPSSTSENAKSTFLSRCSKKWVCCMRKSGSRGAKFLQRTGRGGTSSVLRDVGHGGR